MALDRRAFGLMMESYNNYNKHETGEDFFDAFKEEKKPMKENLSNPRSAEEIAAARAALMAKQAKLNIEMAKLDAEEAARNSQEIAATVEGGEKAAAEAEKAADAPTEETKEEEAHVTEEPVAEEPAVEAPAETAVAPVEGDVATIVANAVAEADKDIIDESLTEDAELKVVGKSDPATLGETVKDESLKEGLFYDLAKAIRALGLSFKQKLEVSTNGRSTPSYEWSGEQFGLSNKECEELYSNFSAALRSGVDINHMLDLARQNGFIDARGAKIKDNANPVLESLDESTLFEEAFDAALAALA